MAAAHYYRILGLRTGADFEAVKLAYRNLARLYHPDVNPGDHLAKEKFVQITQAYQAIADALPAGVSKVSPRTTTTADSTASRPAPPSAAKSVPSTPPPSVSSRGASSRSRGASTRSATTQSATTQSATTNSAPQNGESPAPSQPPIQQPPGGSEADQDLKQSSFVQLQSFLQNQRYPRAVALVEGLAHRFPNDPEIRQWHAITYYRWGQAAISDDNLTKASACLKKAARLDPLNRSLQQSLQQEWQRLAEVSQRPTVGGGRRH
ncbi:MAG: J domain-containing protein [Spirulina sp.]